MKHRDTKLYRRPNLDGTQVISSKNSSNFIIRYEGGITWFGKAFQKWNKVSIVKDWHSTLNYKMYQNRYYRGSKLPGV